jgi:hypothetical protein
MVVPTLSRYRLTVVYIGYGFISWATVIVGSPSDDDRGMMPKNGLGTRRSSGEPCASCSTVS